jgi:hypothetical protein
MKILNVEKFGNQFVMTVELDQGHKEKWVYVREEFNGLVAYSMIEREA